MTTRTAGMALLLIAAAASGCTHYIAFTTATKFALDVSQKGDQTIDVSMGYDRAELASIPSHEENAGPRQQRGSDQKTDVDTYSVLGKFYVNYGNPFSREPLVLNQVFATGMAARYAAASEKGRAYFQEKAKSVEDRKQAQKMMLDAFKGAQQP